MADHHADRVAVEPETPISVSHLVHTLRAYAPVILLSLAALAIGYLILAVALYIASPSQRITMQQFRLDFEGAQKGEYPNGVKFSPSEVVATPILLKVFEANDLGRFQKFTDFSRSVFVLESNPAFERLAADYTARLADPKLTPIDRERIQREWEAKRDSISKNDYSVNYVRTGQGTIPETLVRKTLVDILNTWADYVTREQHVLEYKLAVLSPEVVEIPNANEGDVVVTLQVLRSKIGRVMANIDDLQDIPGADLVRTTNDKMSLEEIKVRLDEILRFRVEPLVDVARSSGMVSNPTATVRFLETQLAYDKRRLTAVQAQADAARQSLAVYAQNGRSGGETATVAEGTGRNAPGGGTSAEGVTPQLSDTFLDRLVNLTSQVYDVKYRQKVAEEYGRLQNQVVPLQAAVAYDEEILTQFRNPSGTSGVNGAQVREQIAATQNDFRLLVQKVNEIYRMVSRNLNPAGELFAMTQPPITRVERSANLGKLALYGLLFLLLSLPLIIVLCLLHNRIRQEEVSEGYVAPVADAVSS
ncbi:MAG TPA: hypothetical protein VGR02_10705 [Thermoanaerobaculia bacterium]|jgi:hypothetical protein|nr:hypothetical protein [Thermoanaerobaculia bacterium]